MGIEGKYSDYHNFLKGLETTRPDNVTTHSTALYVGNLNLEEELSGLAEGSLVVDVGCCAAVGTEGLQQVPDLSHLRFVGVTPTAIPLRDRGTQRIIPIIEGVAEELVTDLKTHDLHPANALLFRNVMQEVCLGESACNAEGLLENVLGNAYESLAKGGKALIYDQYGTGERRGRNFYADYTDLSQQIGFKVNQRQCALPIQKGLATTYLQLVK